MNTAENTIIAGDLNAKHTTWNSNRSNKAGNQIDQLVQSKNDLFVAAPDSPTHYPDNHRHTPDALDIAILKIGSLNYHLENLTYFLSSDHTPILIDLEEKSLRAPPPRSPRTTNWQEFQKEMEKCPIIQPSGTTNENIDYAIQMLSTNLKTALGNNTHEIAQIDRKI